MGNPERLASKANFAEYLVESFGFNDLDIELGKQYFSDVPPLHRVFDSVGILTSIGVINYSRGASFNPARPITRGEAVQMLVRAMDFASIERMP